MEGESSIVRHVSLDAISPNPKQPRKVFKDGDLSDLAASIRKEGVLQPVILSEAQGEAAGRFFLIMGERRFRAAQQAGLKAIPAIIKRASSGDLLRLALVENIQRADLNIIEEAQAYEALLREHSLGQEELAEMVGKDRSTVSNALRMLNLPTAVQNDLLGELLTAGHAKALLSLADHQKIMQIRDIVVAKGLSVRQTEALCRLESPRKNGPMGAEQVDPNIEYLARRLRNYFQTKVRLVGSAEKGKIEISFFSGDDLQRIVEKFTL